MRFYWVNFSIVSMLSMQLGVVQQVVAAPVCLANIRASTPTEDFVLNDSNGTATHLKTGLVWMRCQVGATWDAVNKTCTGTLSDDTWGSGLRKAQGFMYAGYTDWRIPNAKELTTIVEERCHDPSVNETVFPGVSGAYDCAWSSTPATGDGSQAWEVCFHDRGDLNRWHKGNFQHLRLVRGGNAYGDYPPEICSACLPSGYGGWRATLGTPTPTSTP